MSAIRTLKRIARRALPDGVAHAFAMARADEPLMPVLASYARSGTFIDVGANQGLFIHHLRKVAPRVVAFEPVASLADTLRRRYPGVEVHDCALSDAAGTAVLHIPTLNRDAVLTRASLEADANEGFALTPVQVEVKRLDDFAIRDVAAIKIDVEGHEEKVLRGAVETIRAWRPALLVEIEERHHPGRSVPLMRWIEALGYTSHYWHDGALMAAAGFDFARWQRPEARKQVFGRAEAAYVNNFLFVRSA